MEQYNVTGMSCAACSARVEKAVSGVKGVTSCSVSLLTNSMGVEGTASPDAVIKAVEKAGYGASLKGAGANPAKSSDADALEDHETPVLRRRLVASLRDTETPKLRKRLIASVIFLVILMYFSMGHMMWNFPLPHFFDGNHVAMGLVQLLLTVAVMVINQKFFINGESSFCVFIIGKLLLIINKLLFKLCVLFFKRICRAKIIAVRINIVAHIGRNLLQRLCERAESRRKGRCARMCCPDNHCRNNSQKKFERLCFIKLHVLPLS